MNNQAHIHTAAKILLCLLLLIWLCQSALGYGDHRNRKIDSPEQVLKYEESLTWEQRLKAHSDLMWGYLQIDGRKSVKHANAILALTDHKRGLYNRYEAYRLMGQCAYGECLYDSAFHCYRRSTEVIDLMAKSKDYTQERVDDAYSALYGSMGNLYNIQGMLNLAIEYYQKALTIFQKYGWKESQCLVYYNVGELYLEMGNNPAAEQNYRNALRIAHETGDSLMTSFSCTGLSMTLLNNSHYDESLKYALESYAYYAAHAEQESAGLIDCYVLLSRIYQLGFKNTSQANEYINKALLLCEITKAPTNVSDAFTQKASLCMDDQLWYEAARWAHKALNENDQDPHHSTGVYKILAKANAAIGNAQEAGKYIDLMGQTMEETATGKYQSALSEMEVKYETERKEERIRDMEYKQRLAIIVLGVAALAAVVIAHALWYWRRQHKKIQLLRQRLIGEHDERQRLARDLHDRLGGMLTVTKFAIEADNKQKALQLLHETTDEMRKVAHHLMPDSLERYGLHTAISEYCKVLPKVRYRCVGVPYRLSPHIEVLMYSALHELINNALKHSQANNILVQILFDNDKLSVIVGDDGRGFDASEKYAGSGLRNIRERMVAVGGTFEISSSIGKGTEILLTISKTS